MVVVARSKYARCFGQDIIKGEWGGGNAQSQRDTGGGSYAVRSGKE